MQIRKNLSSIVQEQQLCITHKKKKKKSTDSQTNEGGDEILPKLQPSHKHTHRSTVVKHFFIEKRTYMHFSSYKSTDSQTKTQRSTADLHKREVDPPAYVYMSSCFVENI